MDNMCPEFEPNRIVSTQSDTQVGYPMAESGVVTDSNRETDSTGRFSVVDFHNASGRFRLLVAVSRENRGDQFRPVKEEEEEEEETKNTIALFTTPHRDYSRSVRRIADLFSAVRTQLAGPALVQV